MKDCLMGLDVGTSSSKGVLVDFAGGILARATVPHETKPCGPGRYEHDADEIWFGDVCKLSRALLEQSGVSPPRVAGVGISAIAPCVLAVDREGRPLGKGILYGVDTRSTREVERLTLQHGEEALLERCGNLLSSQAAGPKILWIRNHQPEAYRKAAQFMTASSYVVYRLTGETVMDHYTACAGYNPLYDYKKRCWDPEFCGGIVAPERLPALKWACETAGAVTARGAACTGLAEGTPVTVGTADAAAEAVSAGVVEPGQTMLMLGSTLFLITVTAKPCVNPGLWSAPYLFPGVYGAAAGMNAGGSLLQWFRDNLARDLWERSGGDTEEFFRQMTRELGRFAPGSDGLLALPYFCGERTPILDPEAKGAFFGLGLHHRRRHLYQALLESLGYGIRHNLERGGTANWPDTLHTTGGGAQNGPWLQIISDITGIPQTVPRVAMGAAYGDAFLAGLAVGAFDSPLAVRAWTAAGKEVRPDPARKERYDRYYELYLRLYQSTAEIMHAL